MSAYTDDVVGGTASLTFTLAAKNSMLFWVGHDTAVNDFGYGEIEWSQEGNATVGLVAHARYFRTLSATELLGISSVPINQGLPF